MTMRPSLNGDAEAVQSDWYNREQVYRKEAVKERQNLTLDVDSLHRLILDRRIKYGNNESGHKQSPAEQTEKLEARFYPREVEQLGPEVSHHREEVGDSVEDQLVDPLEKDVENAA